MRLKTIASIIGKNVQAWGLRFFGQSHRIVPYKLLLQTTNDCNSRCETCHIWKINKDDPTKKDLEINLKDIENIFKEMSNSLLWLSLAGGEVTLSEDTEEIVRLAKKYCPNLCFITFTTNGLIPKRVQQLAQVIKDHDIDCFVTVSLDGNKEVHDKLRGIQGNFERALESFELIKELDMKVHFGITLSEDNHDFILNEYEDYSSSMRAITFVHNDGIYNKNDEINDQKIISSLKHVYKHYRLNGLADIVEKVHIRLAIKFLELERKKNIIPCDAGFSSLHVFPEGEVSPCMFLPSAGNVKKNSLSQIINSEKYISLKQDARSGNCTKCWMNCYSPHSIMQSPLRSLWSAAKTKVGL